MNTWNPFFHIVLPLINWKKKEGRPSLILFVSKAKKEYEKKTAQIESNKAYSFSGLPYQPCIICIVVRVPLIKLHVSISTIRSVHPAFLPFGLHLLRAWLDRRRRQIQTIVYIHINTGICSTVHNAHAKFQFSIIRSELAAPLRVRERAGERESKRDHMNRVKSSDFVCIAYKIMRASWFPSKSNAF